MNALRRPGGMASLCALLVALALVNAPLARAQGRVLVMENCNGGTTTIVIPERNDGLPKKQGDCAKACSAVSPAT